MPRLAFGFCLAALALMLGGAVSAVAQSSSTAEFAAPSRPRIVIHPRRVAEPGPNAKRQCRSWLAKEYRVSGPVIVPHQQCWWQ